MKQLLDLSSGLEDRQILKLNTVLVHQYQRFERASKQKQKDEPKVESIVNKSSSLLVDLYNKCYNNVATLDFKMDCSNFTKGNSYQLAKMSKNISSRIYQAGISAINETEGAVEMLNNVGYFYFYTDNVATWLVFKCTNTSTNSLQCHLWFPLEGESEYGSDS